MKLKLFRFKSVRSTNSTALRLIKSKITQPTIITSLKQISGRGTVGKKWISKKGNLFFTIFFELKQKKLNFNHFAVLNAYLLKSIICKKFTKKIKIKWPNDLLFDKKKICGILQETVVLEKKNFLIVGIGINTNINPNTREFPSTCLKDITKKLIDNNKVLIMIKRKYELFLSKYKKKYSYSELKKYTRNL